MPSLQSPITPSTSTSEVALQGGYVGPNYRFERFGFGQVPVTRDIAQLHTRLLPESPISKLGSVFMETFYYYVLPRESLIFGFVAYVDGEPAGFVSVTADAEGFMDHGIRRALPILVRAVVPSMLRRPGPALRGIWEALGLLTHRGSPETLGEVLSLGVRPEFRGPRFAQWSGVSLAYELLSKATDELRRTGVLRVRAIVDEDNQAAQA